MVVQRVVQRGVAVLHVRGFDAPVKGRVFRVPVAGVVDVAGTVWRVADDDLDRQTQLLFDAFGVLREHGRIDRVVGLAHLERVRQQRPGERLVVAAHTGVVGLFDVHVHDHRRQRHDLVGVQVVLVFVGQVLVIDETLVLDEAAHVRAGARESVEHMHTPVAQTHTEFPLQGALDHVQLGVDHFRGRVHDAELRGHVLERDGEEVVVDLLDEVLPGLVGHDLGGAGPHRIVQVRESRVREPAFQSRLVQVVQRAVHAFDDGVVRDDLGIVEQGLEDRSGDLVLGEHADRLGLGVVRIQAVPQPLEEPGEPVGRLAGSDQMGDRLGARRSHVGHISGPFAPVHLRAALAHDLRLDGACQFPQTIDVQLALCGFLVAIVRLICGTGIRGGFAVADMRFGCFLPAFVDAAVVEDLDLHDVAQRVGVTQGCGVDLRLEAFVVATQRVDDLPDDLVFRAVGQRYGWIDALGHEDR